MREIMFDVSTFSWIRMCVHKKAKKEIDLVGTSKLVWSFSDFAKLHGER